MTISESIVQNDVTWYVLLDIAVTTCAMPQIPEDQDEFPYIFSISLGVPTHLPFVTSEWVSI